MTDVLPVAQLVGQPLHIVVVREQIQPGIVAQALQTAHGVGDLEIVVVVVAAPQALVQLVVGHRVQHLRVCPAAVIPVDHLAHEPELGLDLVGKAAPLRTVRVIGTKGEIYGEFENNYIRIMTINPEKGKDYDLTEIDLSKDESSAGGHGGGDENLTADFVAFIGGGKPSISCTSVWDSVMGHKIIFLADKSREAGGALIKTGL